MLPIVAFGWACAACLGFASPATPSRAEAEGLRGAAGNAGAGAPTDLLIELEPFLEGLDSPVGLVNAGDGSGRLFVVQQGGEILVSHGSSQLGVFLDISGLVSSGGEQGLLGLAFHPDHAGNGFFYVNYTDSSGDTVIARYSASASDPERADPGSALVLLTIDQPFANHNGGQLQFGPDGYLYIGTGDGGGGGDPLGQGQSLATLLGKLLRIDVDHDDFPQDPTRNHGIPPDNPFVGDPGALNEIWAYGLRNPWRFSFDRATGDLFLGDVGQNEREEIDLQPATSAGGENYGWNRMEGSACFDPPSDCDDGTLVLPILEYPHESGNCSVTGGYRYRGSHRGRFGAYFYGDYCTGRVWAAHDDGQGSWSSQLVLDSAARITSFGEDERGELYLVDGMGAVFRVPEPAPGRLGVASLLVVLGWARLRRRAPPVAGRLRIPAGRVSCRSARGVPCGDRRTWPRPRP